MDRESTVLTFRGAGNVLSNEQPHILKLALKTWRKRMTEKMNWDERRLRPGLFEVLLANQTEGMCLQTWPSVLS